MAFRVEIDPYALDKEWATHSDQVVECHEAIAAARLTYECAKDGIKLLYAELYGAIAANPDRYGLAKVTEAAVDAAVLKQPEYQGAQEELRAAQYDHGMLEASSAALEHRKKALENLVSLHIAGYFAAPRATQATQEDVDTMEKRVLRRRGRRRGQENSA